MTPKSAVKALADWADAEIVRDWEEDSGAEFWFCHYCGEAAATRKEIVHVGDCSPAHAATVVELVARLTEKLAQCEAQLRGRGPVEDVLCEGARELLVSVGSP